MWSTATSNARAYTAPSLVPLPLLGPLAVSASVTDLAYTVPGEVRGGIKMRVVKAAVVVVKNVGQSHAE